MEVAIREHLAGQSPVVCPHTAYSLGLNAIGRMLDAHPRVTIVATLSHSHSRSARWFTSAAPWRRSPQADRRRI